MMTFDNLDAAVAHYFDTLNSPANAWGRNIDAKGNDSSTILHAMNCQFGAIKVDTALEFMRIKEIAKRMGCTLYVRRDTHGRISDYGYITDGTRIAYAQWGRSSRICTNSVHKPNKSVGTGYQVGESINEKTIRDAMDTVAVNWDARNAGNVHKYRDWSEFVASSKFNSEYFEA